MTQLNSKITTNELTRFEKIPTNIFEEAIDASKEIANVIADTIREKAKEGKNCVLGLATGSSPIKVYAELIRLHQEENLSFKNVIS